MGNESWNVYIFGEKETYPCTVNEKCLYLVYDNIVDELYVCTFNKSAFWFIDIHTCEIRGIDNPVFWMPVPSLPKKFVAHTYYKCCGKKSCDYEDDGYCFDMPRGMVCRYRKKCTKYIPKNN